MIELKTLVDNLPIAVFVVDRDRRILLSNRIAKKISCIDRKKRKVMQFGDILRCTNVNENTAGCGFSKMCHLCEAKVMIEEAFSTQKSIEEFETRISTLTQGIRSLRMSITYIREVKQPTPDQEMCLVTIEDMTELEKRERLAAASETIGAVCHEMNQPLQAIFGNVELLTKFKLEDAAISRLEKILMEMERIKSINLKLMSLTQYQTKPYLSTNILDIERSTG